MAEKLIFEEGYKEFEINGDPNRILRFNPTDINLIDRMNESLKDMRERLEALGEIKITPAGDAISDMDEAATTVREINTLLRENIDKLFYPGAADVVFGMQNPLAMAGGSTVYENFMNGLMKAVGPMIEKEKKKSLERVEKYKKAYDRTVAGNGKH